MPTLAPYRDGPAVDQRHDVAHPAASHGRPYSLFRSQGIHDSIFSPFNHGLN